MTRRIGRWLGQRRVPAGPPCRHRGGGLFDERYFLYTEDVDLCAAVRARGRRVQFAADVEIVHLRGRSAASDRRATDAAYRRSQIAFYAKHHPVWVPLLTLYLRLRGRLPDPGNLHSNVGARGLRLSVRGGCACRCEEVRLSGDVR